MAELKTKPTGASVHQFIESIADHTRRKDSKTVLALMQEITKTEPKLWGSAIVGFGDYHYVYESGRENDWFVIGFSPRKQALTIYLMSGLAQFGDILNKLGKHKTGNSCLYIKSLQDININVFRTLIKKSVEVMKKKQR